LSVPSFWGFLITIDALFLEDENDIIYKMFSSARLCLKFMQPSPPRIFIKNFMSPYSVTFPFVTNSDVTFGSEKSLRSIRAELFHKTPSARS